VHKTKGLLSEMEAAFFLFFSAATKPKPLMQIASNGLKATLNGSGTQFAI
jgi:hypothetical protein